jgi:hypothetical protein
MSNNITWINEIKQNHNNYNFLFYDNVNKIKVYNIYIIDNTIEFINKEYIAISNGIINSNSLITYIDKHNTVDNIKFKMDFIYKYCFNISYNNILQNKLNDYYYETHNIFNDIHFNNTIKYFNSLNSLFIFYIKPNISSGSKNNTRKKKSFFNKTKKCV